MQEAKKTARVLSPCLHPSAELPHMHVSVLVGPEIMRAKTASLRLAVESGCVAASTDHLCLQANAATNCTKICNGHAVMNSLFTPASEAVLSVPRHAQAMHGLSLGCPSKHKCKVGQSFKARYVASFVSKGHCCWTWNSACQDWLALQRACQICLKTLQEPFNVSPACCR